MTEPPGVARPDDYSVGPLLPVLDLREVGTAQLRLDSADVAGLQLPGRQCRVFTGPSQLQRYQRTFGGQLMAQAIVAAARTVDGAGAARPVHSLHVTFLAGGDDTREVSYVVEPLGDGRSFSQRRVQVVQDGVLLAVVTVSFQQAAPGLEHGEPMPDVPDADSLPEVAGWLAGVPGPYAPVCVLRGPIELRHAEGTLYAAAPERHTAGQSVWFRAREALPDDPVVHAAVLAYACDYSVLEPVLRAHGIWWGDPRLRQASLDHAMWFHRPVRADEWVLHSLTSPSASGGRGLGLGRMYAADGTHVATLAQEGMIRLKS